ncbi:MAG: hypothetical protein EAZ97_16265 [Bacteroidetes bacterium]|nr:MAG: hypothetical protein EAZ97_16265 [Bacteroidota bacterium]
MNALEFSTKIEQGIIRLPKKYQAYDNAQVRIIILIESPNNYLSRKEKLLLAFKKMEKQNMFQSIENPKIWQKKLRNEWE